MKVLLTGSSGFIGSHLLNAALAMWGPENVTVLSSRPTVRAKCVVYRPDFTLDDTSKTRLVDNELLIHAGAYTPKSSSTANSINASNGNIAFTDMLLALPMPRLRKVVYLSTIDVYASSKGALTEDSPVQPGSLYGWSKLYCEQLVQQYGVQHDLATQILRIGHVYGPGEEQYSKFLPNALRNIVTGKAVELWGEGNELRSLIFINDVVRAVFAAASLAEAPGVINVAGSIALPVCVILERVIALAGLNTPFLRRESNGNPRDFVFDTKKMKKFLLATETDLDDGLRVELAHMANIYGK